MENESPGLWQMGRMREGGIECESKVQNLSTWTTATLVAVEGKIWRSCVWMEGEFYFNVDTAFEEKALLLKEGRTGGRPHANRAQLFLKEYTNINGPTKWLIQEAR